MSDSSAYCFSDIFISEKPYRRYIFNVSFGMSSAGRPTDSVLITAEIDLSEKHIKLFYDKKSYHVTDKYTPNGALYKIAQNMQFFCSCASYVKNNVHLETEYKT